MKILLIGSTGQLGREIIKSSPNGIKLFTPSRLEFDLAKNKQRTNAINEHLPQILIHRPAGFLQNSPGAAVLRSLAAFNAFNPPALASSWGAGRAE